MELIRKDFLLFFALIGLISLSLITLASISVNEEPAFYSLKRQAIFFILGFTVFFILSSIDWRSFLDSSFIITFYFFSLFLLFLVLIFGTTIKGATGWFQIGSLNFQPVEIAKIALILILAKFLSSYHKETWQYPLLLKTAFFTFLPVMFVIFQPDLGGVIVLTAIWFLMILVSGIRLNQIVFLIVIFLIILILGWFFFLQPYQIERIINFLNPETDPMGSGYSRQQSLIAIGSGRIFGKGLGWGTQTQFRFLPLAKTDFIFAALSEELGLVGVSLLLILLLIFIWRLIFWANNLNNNFCSLFVIGFAAKILVESFINIGMNTGLLPVIGIALPFVSLGGSQILANFICLGIIGSMIKYQDIF